MYSMFRLYATIVTVFLLLADPVPKLSRFSIASRNSLSVILVIGERVKMLLRIVLNSGVMS